MNTITAILIDNISSCWAISILLHNILYSIWNSQPYVFMILFLFLHNIIQLIYISNVPLYEVLILLLLYRHVIGFHFYFRYLYLFILIFLYLLQGSEHNLILAWCLGWWQLIMDRNWLVNGLPWGSQLATAFITVTSPLLMIFNLIACGAYLFRSKHGIRLYFCHRVLFIGGMLFLLLEKWFWASGQYAGIGSLDLALNVVIRLTEYCVDWGIIGVLYHSS